MEVEMEVNRSRSNIQTEPTCLTKTTSATWDQWIGWRPIAAETQPWTDARGWVGEQSTILDRTRPKGYKPNPGEIVMNDVQLTRRMRQIVPGELKTYVPCGIRHEFSGDFGPLLSDIWEPRLIGLSDFERVYHKNVALVKAYAKMNQPDIVSGEYVAEFSKTVSMLRRPFSNTYKLLSKIHKAKKRLLKNKTLTAKNLASAASGAWLEHRYGWKPIMLDAGHVIDSLYDHYFVPEHGRLRVARGQSKVSANDTADYSSNLPHDASFHVDFERSLAETLRADAGVLYRVSGRNTLQQAQAYLGVRTRDIPATMWELTPFSFVVDWFSNVGLMLQALTPNPEVKILGHWSTIVKVSETRTGPGTITCTSDWNTPSVSTGSIGSVIEVVTEYCRVCNEEIAFTPLVPRLNLGPIQATSGAALSIQGIINSLKKVHTR